MFVCVSLAAGTGWPEFPAVFLLMFRTASLTLEVSVRAYLSRLCCVWVSGLLDFPALLLCYCLTPQTSARVHIFELIALHCLYLGAFFCATAMFYVIFSDLHSNALNCVHCFDVLQALHCVCVCCINVPDALRALCT